VGSNPTPSAPTSYFAFLTWAYVVLGTLVRTARWRSLGTAPDSRISLSGGHSGATISRKRESIGRGSAGRLWAGTAAESGASTVAGPAVQSSRIAEPAIPWCVRPARRAGSRQPLRVRAEATSACLIPSLGRTGSSLFGTEHNHFWHFYTYRTWRVGSRSLVVAELGRCRGPSRHGGVGSSSGVLAWSGRAVARIPAWVDGRLAAWPQPAADLDVAT
jgi:hypothetical protein